MSITVTDRRVPASPVTDRGGAADLVTAGPATSREPAALDASTLARWGAMIAADGIGAHEREARLVVGAAAGIGLCPVLVDVLADPGEPAAARERAFGRLALTLATAGSV